MQEELGFKAPRVPPSADVGRPVRIIVVSENALFTKLKTCDHEASERNPSKLMFGTRASPHVSHYSQHLINYLSDPYLSLSDHLSSGRFHSLRISKDKLLNSQNLHICYLHCCLHKPHDQLTDSLLLREHLHPHVPARESLLEKQLPVVTTSATGKPAEARKPASASCGRTQSLVSFKGVFLNRLHAKLIASCVPDISNSSLPW